MTTATTKSRVEYEILSTDEVFDILDKLQDRIEDTKHEIIKGKASRLKEILDTGYDRYSYKLRDLDRYNDKLDTVRTFLISDDADTYYIESDKLKDILSWNADKCDTHMAPWTPFRIRRQVPMPEGFIEAHKSVRFNSKTNQFDLVPLTDSDREYMENNYRFFVTIDGIFAPKFSDPAIFMLDTGVSYSVDCDTYYASTNISDLFQYLYWGRTLIDGVRTMASKALNNQDVPLVYRTNDIAFIRGLGLINETITKMVSGTKDTSTIGSIKRCADCNMLYIIEDSEEVWYNNKGMQPPKRCPSCRAKRKANKA